MLLVVVMVMLAIVMMIVDIIFAFILYSPW